MAISHIDILRDWILHNWNDATSLRWELILALIGLIFLLEPEPPSTEPKRRRNLDRTIAFLGLLAGLTYFNFGFFHFGNYVHNWDAFHYYVGAKYFPELGYEHLYECTTVADTEDQVPNITPTTPITRLSDNQIVTVAGILADPQVCKAHFSAERWQDFKQDVAYFRSHEANARWIEMRTDHGFNATPVWLIAGSWLANLSPASDQQIHALILIDPFYWLAACGAIAWAFGWRVLCVTLLVFATFVPCRFYWTGGSILRWDWLFYTVAGVCCLKKERPLLGGFAIGYAMLLRVFPGVLFLGPVLLAVDHWFLERRLDRNSLHFIAGGILAVAFLMPLSQLLAGSRDIYPAFLHNSIKHEATPLTNNMGLRTVLSYRPDIVGRHLRDSALLDPWQKWKEARLQALGHAKLAYLIFVAAFIALLWRAVRRADAWTAAALATTMIPVIFELTGYYYAFILATATLSARDARYGLWLLGLSAFSGFVSWAPLPFMPGWLDEQSVLLSVTTLLVFAALLWDFGRATSKPQTT